MTPVLGPVEARLVLDLAGLPSLRLEHTLTHRVLAAIPAAHEHYRPRVGARSAGELARHIVSAEIRFLDGAATGAFADPDSALEAATDLSRLLQFYDRAFAVALERLNATAGDQLARVIDYRGVVRMPALGFVQLAMNHTIHHRGQLSVYLRARNKTSET
jgi:uncharacterized damage-inducible protein DinB